MTEEDREKIALRELSDLLDYDYKVFTDAEYFKLPWKDEKQLLNTHEAIAGSGFVLYYKKRDK